MYAYFPVGTPQKKYLKKNKKITKKTKKQRVTAPILKPTDDQKPEPFFDLTYHFHHAKLQVLY